MQNIPAARLLLQRDDVDMRLKDREGLTPFDVYNSTVDGTNPSPDPLSTHPLNPGRVELLSWGSNRNYTLGFPTDSERATPERVTLRREEGGTGLAAFEPLRVKDVNMARLHTAIVTDEKVSNIRLCGYGTGGRCVAPSLALMTSAEVVIGLTVFTPHPGSDPTTRRNLRSRRCATFRSRSRRSCSPQTTRLCVRLVRLRLTLRGA